MLLTIDGWYAMLMAVLMVAISPLCTTTRLGQTLLSNTTVLMRLVGGIFSLNIPLTLLCNFSYVIVVGVCYTYNHTNLESLPWPTNVWAAETCIFIMMTMFLLTLRAEIWAECYKEVEVERARSEKSAVMALLNTMSDAVVELDENLQIVGDAPQLGCMLLHGEGRRPLGETRFDQFAATPTDAQKFMESISRISVDVEPVANGFHMNLRDSLHNVIGVEVYHVCKPCKAGESRRHLIGVREHVENERLNPPTLPGGGAGRWMQAYEAYEQTSTGISHLERTSTGISESAEESFSTSSIRRPEGHVPQVDPEALGRACLASLEEAVQQHSWDTGQRQQRQQQQRQHGQRRNLRRL